MTYTHILADPSTLTVEHIERLNEDGSISWIPINNSNSDYKDYLKWLEENNG